MYITLDQYVESQAVLSPLDKIEKQFLIDNDVIKILIDYNKHEESLNFMKLYKVAIEVWNIKQYHPGTKFCLLGGTHDINGNGVEYIAWIPNGIFSGINKNLT